MNGEPLLRRAARRALRTFRVIPEPVQSALLGPLQRNDRNEPIDRELQVLLAIQALISEPRGEGARAVRKARVGIDLQAPMADFPPAKMERVEDRRIPGPDVEIPIRIYEARNRAASRPAVVYFHGGGFCIGTIDSHDGVCRYLARETDGVVISVDYRLAPEHRFPAAAIDSIAAFRWVAAHASELGIDHTRIAVAGDSAGGNLAAVVALETRGDAVAPAFQLLVYPCTDFTRAEQSHRTFRRGFLLEEETIDWFLNHYLEDPPRQERDPLASVLFREDLAGVAPAYVSVAGFDPLRDEGEKYAERLRAAGVPAELSCEGGLVHGFFSMGGTNDASRDAIERATYALKRALAALR